MKIKFFGSIKMGILTEKVNQFIQDKKVVDIKMTEDDEGYYTLMVMYEDA